MNLRNKTYRLRSKLIFIVMSAMILVYSSPVKAIDSILTNKKIEESIKSVVAVDLSENEKWNKLIHKLEKKSNLPQAYFIDFLFYKTHNVLLKSYQKHTNFEEMLASGNYDCVSASLTYSLLLKHFDIPHSIIETDYHIFLVIRIDNKDYIYESTDPINGFIKQESQVLNYIANFRPGKKMEPNNRIQGQMEMLADEEAHINTIYKEINVKQLVGLQYYNQAIYAINLQEYELAKQKMSQALQLYPSERIQSVFQFIAQMEE